MNPRSSRRSLLVLTAVVALVAACLATGANAASGPIRLSGTQIAVDESKGLFKVTGSLLGDWTITAFTPHYATADQIAATGKERFVGCYDANRNQACDVGEPSGALTFTMVYWARFKGDGKTLVTGACVHPMTGGSKGFAKAKGVVFMKDTPVGNGVRTTYTGTLDLGASAARVGARSLSIHRNSTGC